MTIQEKANQEVQLLSTGTEFFGVTNQMMTIQLYSPAEMFVMLFKLALIFEYKNKILRCYRIVLSYRTVNHRGFTFDSKSSSMANQM